MSINELMLCEYRQLVLRPDELYRFTVDPKCAACCLLAKEADASIMDDQFYPDENVSPLPCPFCGGEAEHTTVEERTGYGVYESTEKYHVVKCKKCQGSGQRYQQELLLHFTSHTIADFRDNPLLRAEVEDEYEAYCQQTKQQAIDAWNNRADTPQMQESNENKEQEMERKEYEMTQADLDELLDACKPVPHMTIGGVPPSSPQGNANAAWAKLGKRMGFDYMTVQPTGRGDRFFSAVPDAEPWHGKLFPEEVCDLLNRVSKGCKGCKPGICVNVRRSIFPSRPSAKSPDTPQMQESDENKEG